MATLETGDRVVADCSIYGYLDERGTLLYHGPLIKGLDEPTDWEWKIDMTGAAGEPPPEVAQPTTDPRPGPTYYSTISDAVNRPRICTDGDFIALVELQCRPIVSTGTDQTYGDYFIMGEDTSPDTLKVYCQDSVTTDLRVNTVPTVYGEKMVMRILDKQNLALGLPKLGFLADDQETFTRLIGLADGIILVTGPTGSGKTTSLYAALTEIRSPEDKIVTIEDPVEYQVDGITQIPVNEKKGLTFARGLRSILRHDPDKIMVGEIRDPETAQIAIQSALTGHLVFTTVHANNVFDVIGRFLHMQVDPYSFISALNCILAQRLVRLLCPRCKVPVRYTPAQLAEAGLDPARHAKTVFYEAKGCPECNATGYQGREAIAEILELSDPIRELILEKRPLSEVKKRAKAEGMVFLREVGMDKVLAGLTGLRDLNKVTFVE